MATRRETAKAGAAMGNGPAKATASRARKEARPRGRRPFAGVPEIHSFFRTNQTPVYFVSPTPFNGNEAGVPSVPNVLGRATSYEGLLELASTAGLGEDLVVQMPYGDSGK